MNFEISFRGKICNFISVYRSLSHSSDTFEDFADDLELNWDKIANKSPHLLVVIGDFNFKLSNWNKSDKTTYEGSKIDTITSHRRASRIFGGQGSKLQLLGAGLFKYVWSFVPLSTNGLRELNICETKVCEIVKLKFVNCYSKNEKIVEKLRMSRFLLHLLINSWTLFYFRIKLHNIEHTFKTHDQLK